MAKTKAWQVANPTIYSDNNGNLSKVSTRQDVHSLQSSVKEKYTSSEDMMERTD